MFAKLFIFIAATNMVLGSVSTPCKSRKFHTHPRPSTSGEVSHPSPGSTISTGPTISAVHLTVQPSLNSSRKWSATPNPLKSYSNVSLSFRKRPRELSPSKFARSRPKPLSSSNSPAQASAHSPVTCRAGLGALLVMTVAFPATTLISYLLTVLSPAMISASPVTTLVANISTSKDPTGTGRRPPLLSVLPIVRLQVRLNPVHNPVLISVQASTKLYTLDNAERDVRPFFSAWVVCTIKYRYGFRDTPFYKYCWL